VKYVNTTSFPFAVLPGRIRPPEWSATLIVKASFALRPGGLAELLPEPLPFMGDVYRDEEIANDCLYESDFAAWKQNADVLLAGTCHAPGGKPTTACRIEFGVGRWSKALAVIGTRRWKKSLLMSSASDPEPFTSMPVTYPNAYGGEGFDKNPSGRGYEKAYLPNIEPLEDRISGPGDRPDPSGFGPLNRTWPQRASKLGSYRGKWLKERWPNFPEDFDFTYHNAAPEDQQFRKYLHGDEELRFENLHPKHASYRSALPGLRIRGFLSERMKAGKRFREVPMNLDTLFVDMDKEILVLIWRGVAIVLSEELTEVEHAVAVMEPLKDAPGPAAKFEALLPPVEPPKPAVPPPPPAPKPPSPMKLQLEAAKAKAKELEAAHLDGARALAKSAGFDLDAAMAKPPGGVAELHASLVAAKAAFEKLGATVPGLMEAEIAAVAPGGKVDAAVQRFQTLNLPKGARPAITADTLKAATAKPGGLKAKDKDLTGAPLSGADLSGMDLSGVILKDADLSKAKLVKTILKGAQLTKANLTGADLSGAVLEKADLTKAKLAEAKLGGASLLQADFSEADAPKANFAGAQAPKSLFSGANLEGAVFEKTLLSGADFSRANLKGAKFPGAVLVKAAFSGAKAEGADFSGADLSGAHGAEKADFKKALFIKATGPQSVWEESSFEGADFSGALLVRANFAGASLKQAKLVGVDAKNASFRKAVLMLAQAAGSDFLEATFEKADLSGADFTGANLFGAEFLGTILEGTKLKGANLTMSKLA
jgi:uncharacterized protein YjbI with pentapeptide repeats